MLQPAIVLVPNASTTPLFLAFTAGSSHTLPGIVATQEPKSGSEAPAGGPTGAGTVAPGTPGGGAPQGGAVGPAGGSDLLLYMGLAVVVMLFLSMRRDSKARKEQQAMLASIKKEFAASS